MTWKKFWRAGLFLRMSGKRSANWKKRSKPAVTTPMRMKPPERRNRPPARVKRISSALEKARAAVDGLTRELQTLETNRAAAEEEVNSQSVAYTDLQKKLSIQKEKQPDLAALQAELDKQKAEENKLRIEVGGAKQESGSSRNAAQKES